VFAIHRQTGAPVTNIQSTLPNPPYLFKNISLAVLFGKGKGKVCSITGHEGPDEE